MSLKPFGRPKKSVLRRPERQAAEAVAMAQRRMEIARLAAGKKGTLEQKRSFVADLIAAGKCPRRSAHH